MATVRVTVDVDLDEIDNDEIIEHFMDFELYEELDDDQVKKILNFWGESSELGAETLRDQQYEEVFDQLKEKFSVAELEALVNSK